MKKQMIALGMMIVLSLGLLPETTLAAGNMGNIKSDPIIVTEKDSAKSSFDTTSSAKYFRVNIKERGRLNLQYSSEKVKKDVRLVFSYDSNEVQTDEISISYNKKKKEASGNLKTSMILTPGNYDFKVVCSEPLTQAQKFEIKTKFTTINCDDAEPNNDESLAQTIRVGNKKKTYAKKLILSNMGFDSDTTDYLKFNIKSKKKIRVYAEAKTASGIKVIIKKKTELGSVPVNSDSSDQTLKKKGKKYAFDYTTTLNEKGTYYIMVWLDSLDKQQVEYKLYVEEL